MDGDREPEIEAGTGFPLDYGMPKASFDARTTARLARTSITTISVWFQRDVIPGETVGTQGKARHFTADLAYFIAIVAALSKLGVPAPIAANHAVQAHYQAAAGPGLWLVAGPVDVAASPSRPVAVIKADDWGTLGAQIAERFPETNSWAVIDIGAIWRRVHDAALAEVAAKAGSPT